MWKGYEALKLFAFDKINDKIDDEQYKKFICLQDKFCEKIPYFILFYRLFPRAHETTASVNLSTSKIPLLQVPENHLEVINKNLWSPSKRPYGLNTNLIENMNTQGHKFLLRRLIGSKMVYLNPKFFLFSI